MTKRMGKKAMSAAPHNDNLRRKSPFARLFRRFFVDAKGATAIEFAILGIPFALVFFAILESCISFGAGQVLANAADDVARQLRTGQLRPKDMDKGKLETMICDRIKIIVGDDCTDGLEVDLQEYTTFADAAKVKIKYTTDNDLDTTGFKVTPGPAQSKNMLRVFYKWPVMTDFMKLAMSNLKGGKTLQFTAVVWQNEPFNN